MLSDCLFIIDKNEIILVCGKKKKLQTLIEYNLPRRNRLFNILYLSTDEIFGKVEYRFSCYVICIQG